jgi:hypothetical protein
MKKTDSPPPDRRRALLRSIGSWALTIGLAAAVFVGVSEWRRASLLPDGAGKPAPDVTLLDLEGRPVPLSSFRGKAVMLHFWGPW